MNYRESYGLYAVSGILFNHESPRRGHRVRDPQGDRRRRPHQARARAASSGSATSTPGATGASPATTSTRCGGCCSSRPAAGLRDRHRGDPQRARAGGARLRPRGARLAEARGAAIPKFYRPGRGGPAARRSRARRGASWAGRPRSSFAELVAMMVDADLERLTAAAALAQAPAGDDESRVRVLVTGADGFVGRHLVRHLLEAGDEVAAGCRPGGAAGRLALGAPTSGRAWTRCRSRSSSDAVDRRRARVGSGRDRPPGRGGLGARGAARIRARPGRSTPPARPGSRPRRRACDAAGADPPLLLRLERRGLRRRPADGARGPRRDPLRPRLAVRGQQGGRRDGRARGLAPHRPPGRGRPAVSAHRPGPEPELRRAGLRRAAPGGARRRAPRRCRPATSSRCATSSTCATWSRPTAAAARAGARARRTTSPAATGRLAGGGVPPARGADRCGRRAGARSGAGPRATDIPHLVGDSTKLRRATGWAPTISLEQTLQELVDAQAD